MTDVDITSTIEWPPIIKALQLTKTINEIRTQDILGNKMESLQKWETFYTTYAYWMGFSI